MGRPEGQGCYCFANNVLREVLQRLTKTYRHIVLDSEAGLEHISRRTLLALDYLLIVSDCTVRGIHTAARISALADEVALPAKARGLIINRVPDGKLPPVVNQAACETGLPLLAIVPLDPQVAALDAGGVPIGNIAPDAPARVCLSAMLEKLLTAH
jgi:CO dehydrogenase maturation factor